MSESVLIALPTVAGWLGWLTTIGIAVTVAGLVPPFTIWHGRRERAMRNPYRAILRLTDRAMLTRTTVIAPRPRER